MDNDVLALAMARATRAEEKFRQAVNVLDEEVKALEARTSDVLQAARALRAKGLATVTTDRKGSDPTLTADLIDPERLYKPFEAAQILGISAAAVSSYICVGTLKAVNVQAPGATRPRWNISGATLSEYIENRHNRRRNRSTGV